MPDINRAELAAGIARTDIILSEVRTDSGLTMGRAKWPEVVADELLTEIAEMPRRPEQGLTITAGDLADALKDFTLRVRLHGAQIADGRVRGVLADPGETASLLYDVLRAGTGLRGSLPVPADWDGTEWPECGNCRDAGRCACLLDDEDDDQGDPEIAVMARIYDELIALDSADAAGRVLAYLIDRCGVAT